MRILNGCEKSKVIPQEPTYRFCKECMSPDAYECSVGEVTYCPDCHSVEAGYVYLTEKEMQEVGLE